MELEIWSCRDMAQVRAGIAVAQVRAGIAVAQARIGAAVARVRGYRDAHHS